MTEDNKAILCHKSLADAPADYAWQADPELARLTATIAITISLTDYLVEYAKQINHKHLSKHLFAIKTCKGKHIGNCACYGIDKTKGEAEIGIMIGDRRYWGKGYGTNVVNSLVQYTFSQIKSVRIRLKTLESNKRAQKCFFKCGFTVCGNIVSNGNNFILMELLRKQWQRNKDKYPQSRQLILR